MRLNSCCLLGQQHTHAAERNWIGFWSFSYVWARFQVVPRKNFHLSLFHPISEAEILIHATSFHLVCTRAPTSTLVWSYNSSLHVFFSLVSNAWGLLLQSSPLTNKAVNGSTPSRISRIMTLHTPSRPLCSLDARYVSAAPPHRKSFGWRVLAWTAILLLGVCDSSSYWQFQTWAENTSCPILYDLDIIIPKLRPVTLILLYCMMATAFERLVCVWIKDWGYSCTKDAFFMYLWLI